MYDANSPVPGSPVQQGWIRVTVLGSGTSTGVPVIGCDCSTCTSADSFNHRTRASVMITFPSGQNIVIDTGPDFRHQMLRHRVTDVAAVFYTHTHADHCHGFDDIRAYFFRSRRPMDCYMAKLHVPEFKERFAYAFKDIGYMGTKPQVTLHPFDAGGPVKVFEPFFEHSFETVLLPHGDTYSVGFRLGGFAYTTDFKTFPPDLIARWRGQLHTLIASGVRYKTLPTHSTLPETLALMDDLKVRRGIVSHLNHDIDYGSVNPHLPPGRALAYDGMVIDVPLTAEL